jgi:hypothetical protein
MWLILRKTEISLTNSLNYILPDGTPVKLDSPPFNLPIASASVLGGVKVGTGLSIADGVLKNSNPTAYSLPTASASVLGGVKVGTGLSISSGTLSATYNPSSGYGPIIPTASYWRNLKSLGGTIPAGGTWAYFSIIPSGDGSGGVTSSGSAGVAAGGTSVSVGSHGQSFCWRVI